jgi:tRNA uridine 5-carbamoylmethylation protein Kti12|tara:strand:- start:805 stop:1002 length:198 start_codon:yes stop_codon:yes gene_type:complete
MSEKTKTKKELEEELEKATEQLNQLSVGYQSLVTANRNLAVLVNKYEETINLLTARLLEGRQAQD